MIEKLIETLEDIQQEQNTLFDFIAKNGELLEQKHFEFIEKNIDELENEIEELEIKIKGGVL